MPTIDNDLSARQAARANGSTMYEGKACSTHPGALRYVASKACVECAKAARKANVNTEKDKMRKRLARAAARQSAVADHRPSVSSMICEIIGL